MMVQVDRETAGRLGVSLQQVNDTLNDAFAPAADFDASMPRPTSIA